MAENNIASSQVIPWKVRIMLSVSSTLTDLTRRSDGTVNRRLMKLFESCAKVPPHQSGQGLKVSDVTVDSTRNLWFPTNVPDHFKLPILVYFHGGYFTWTSPDVRPYDAMCRQFAKRLPAIVVSVNYRLTPGFCFPAQYEDGFDTLKFLDRKSFDSFPTNANLLQCFLAGDSAGGNIAHHVAQRFAEAGRKLALESVCVPEGVNRDHEAVNVFGPNSVDISSLKNFPSTLVFVGGLDPLKDWQKRYFHGLKRSGKEAQLIEYPNVCHGFYVFPDLPETSLLFREVMDFIHNNVSTNK